ncbi:hypothetical protein [Streptomyces europaeiscabiei]|uniref:hypothetical protein n=1 Tax=Streptomyces europaeiscabiei TaxID=146819 RepID=UPI0029C0F119|nr:hypothetical protein [Streptomyces europaeiscabiei]
MSVLPAISVGIAGLSLLVAASAYWFSRYSWKRRKEQNRRDLFLELHAKLSSKEQMQGRRILRERVKSVGDAEELRDRPEDASQVYSALAMLDILGLYVDEDFVDGPLVLAEWGHVVVELHSHAQYVLTERRANGGSFRSQWPHYQTLAGRATGWVSQQR